MMGFFEYHERKSSHIAVSLRPVRSKDYQHASMWTTLSPGDAVLAEHPLRPIRKIVNGILAELSPEFAPLCSKYGRPSTPPERLLRTLLAHSP